MSRLAQTLVIAGQGRAAYVPAMASLVRLLALLALVLMPFGMASAPAAAHGAATTQPVAPAAQTGEHCDQQQRPDMPAKPKTDCAMACAALLPEGAIPLVEELRPAAPRHAVLISPAPGAGPELATPPPKLG
ncbi:hypothetical protein ACFQPG_00770 [Sphingomonas sp. GCM10030256]|uniref:hypothetical protein n=1 Tax=Sphingomonas sp. GCM10030256 TaxID=3273427 RepID=UPI003618228A